jgi:hypothetical protein
MLLIATIGKPVLNSNSLLWESSILRRKIYAQRSSDESVDEYFAIIVMLRRSITEIE